MIAAGLDGIRQGLQLEDALIGNAYASDSEHVPTTMAEAADAWTSSEWIGATFGSDVQAHYANMARVEVSAFNKTITEWERFRSFERL